MVNYFSPTLRVSELWQGGVFEQKSTHPSFYLPAVAANFTSASSLALLGYHDLGYLFFGAGMITWIFFEPVLLQHLRISSLEPQFRATIGIVLAPAFVCVSAYLSINHGEVDTLAKILWGYGFLQLFFLLRLFPWIVEKGLNIGLWAFSFGLASMANSATAFYHGNVLQGVSIFAFVFSNLMIGLLVLMTIYKLTKGAVFPKIRHLNRLRQGFPALFTYYIYLSFSISITSTQFTVPALIRHFTLNSYKTHTINTITRFTLLIGWARILL
ncbi:potassium-tellurite ethidium and proflavin transporter [Haemophilus influenzae]|uniref:Potassium-tellurite ethidium and proflavin transporter n=1 Tax=Haemophilus influenzae TaxID=727 RepID=A0A2X1RQ05_HAEIF|nr:potassium-tellurite ethidium and proflavin transporter [Haemophilus influenzae]